MIGAGRCTYHALAFVFASMFIDQVTQPDAIML